MSIPFRPDTDLLPSIEGAEFAEFVEDMRQCGLRDPIVLHEGGGILDGRTRYRAFVARRDSGTPRGDLPGMFQ